MRIRLSDLPVICRVCKKTVPRTSNRQDLCVECRGERWKLSTHGAVNGRTVNAEAASAITWPATIPEPDLVTLVRVALPFTWLLSKNAWLRFGRGMRAKPFSVASAYTPSAAKAARQALHDRLTLAASRAHFYQRKTYIDILVQKPQHRGDAINVIDTVCDAAKKAIGIDDHWFCIRRLDWEIVKVNPRLYVGIGQDGACDQNVCSACGLVLDVTEFHRSRAEKTGYSRICRKCRRVPTA
jgi:hypothetical protein